MNSIGQKIVAALDAALAPPSPADQFAALARAIIKQSGRTLASKDQLEALRRLQASYDSANKIITAHTLERSKAAWLDSLSEIQKLIAQDGDITRLDAFTRRDFEEDFEAKRTIGKQELQRIALETAKIADPIKARFVAMANALADEVENRERAEYARFGLDASQSNLVTTLRGAGDLAQHRGGHPRQAVPYLDF